jgi:hypothetical protein
MDSTVNGSWENYHVVGKCMLTVTWFLKQVLTFLLAA